MVASYKPAGFSSCKEGFFGRKQILEDLKKRAETKGLTFIVGPPRRGKTRLMFELARSLEDSDSYLYSYYELISPSANPFHYCVERLSENYIRKAPNLKKAKEFISSQFKKINNITGVLLKIAGKFDPTIEAASTLSDSMGQSQSLRRLPYEIIRETVNKISEESKKSIVLFLDQWEMGEENEENGIILQSFLNDPYGWPHVHIFVNLRQNGKAHKDCKNLAGDFTDSVEIIEPLPLDLQNPKEIERILNLLHKEVPLTKEISEDSLLKAIEVTPMVIDRILDNKFDDAEGLEETIKGAVEGTYRDIIKKIDKLNDSQRRTLIFLSLLPELTPESWEELKNLGEDFSCPPECLDHLRQQGILNNVNPPQASHTTAWETILKHLKTELNLATTLDLGHRLAQTLAIRIIHINEEDRVFFISLLEVIKKLKPEGSKPWLEALEIVALSLVGQNIEGQLPKLCDGVKWALKNNQALLPFITNGLINLTVGSKLEERRQCVQEIRMLYELDADHVAIRERLAMGLHNLTAVSELVERRQCVQEIRTLYELDVDNVAIREHLAKGLANVWIKTKKQERKNVSEELRVLRNRWPDDEVWKLDAWAPIFEE